MKSKILLPVLFGIFVLFYIHKMRKEYLSEDATDDSVDVRNL